MKKVASVIVIVLIVAMILVMMYGNTQKIKKTKPQITVSTFALYDVSRFLLHDIADVTMLVPFGKDIHTFEPSPQDMARIEQSRYFLYSGAGLEPWAEAFARKNSVDMSQYVTLQALTHDHDTHGSHHEMHRFDPHYWLDIDNMVAVTKALTNLFESAFGAKNAEEILKRSITYIKMLRSLDELYKKRLSSCRRDLIIVDHNAYGYLSSRYGFEVLALKGMSSDALPDAKHVAHLSDVVHEKEVWTLFAEPFGSDALIRSVAQSAGVKVQLLQPLANITEREEREQYNYRLIMQLNLKKLHIALECE